MTFHKITPPGAKFQNQVITEDSISDEAGESRNSTIDGDGASAAGPVADNGHQ